MRDMKAAVTMIRQINEIPNDDARVHLLRIFAVQHAECDPDDVAFLDDEEILSAWGEAVIDVYVDDLGSPVVDFEADRK